MSLHPADHELRPADNWRMQIPTLIDDRYGDILTTSCRHFGATQQADQAAQLDRLIEAGSRIDAALALIAMELPQWRLRRLVYDGGEWHCALSSHREMPEWLDPSIESHHPDMAAAIVDALREAIRTDASPHPTTASWQPKRSESFEPVACENYV